MQVVSLYVIVLYSGIMFVITVLKVDSIVSVTVMTLMHESMVSVKVRVDTVTLDVSVNVCTEVMVRVRTTWVLVTSWV